MAAPLVIFPSQGTWICALPFAWPFLKNGTVYVRSGAGIVADSNPESEYLECLHKAGAVVEALEKGGTEGHDFTH